MTSISQYVQIAAGEDEGVCQGCGGVYEDEDEATMASCGSAAKSQNTVAGSRCQD